MTKRSQNKFTQARRLAESSGMRIKMVCLLNWGPVPSPGSLCLQAVFSKAVSVVKDYTSNTGVSDLKNTPGLLDDGKGKYVGIYGGSWRRRRMRGSEMGDFPRRQVLSLKAEQELKIAPHKREQDSDLYGRNTVL